MHTTRATSRKDSLASLRRKALPLSLSLLLCGALASAPAQAGGGVGRTTTPTGGTIVGGSGSILQDGANVVINQTSDKLVLNWQSFNLGQDALVRFNQPGSSAVALNRILDQNPSQIFGQISSNGQVFLINIHGIIFGSTAQVNVGGLVASTLDLTPTDFLSNHFNLNAVGGGAGIVNHGTIAAASGGSISLIGGSVANDGVILANYGRINLDGAEHAVLDFDGNGLINVQITGELKQRLDAKAAVSNAGTLQADGGTVVMEASAARDLFTSLVNNSGVIDAGAISHDGGVVRLVARGGDTVNSGSIDATGAHGGNVQLLSDRNVGVTGGSIDASGTYGGGAIRVGGGWQGGEGLQTANAVYVDGDATLKADATRNGDGGSVVVWGNQVNNFYGSISARGGANGGDGGRVETSSHEGLNAQGHVDASAAHGNMGSWLLDPYNITISSGTDSKVSGGPVYTPSGNPSVVNAGEIGAALTGGTSVYVFTNTAGGSQNGDITVNAPITASGAGQLYLQAFGSIFVNDDITAAAGQSLDVHLWANYAGTAGASTYTKGSCTTSCVVSIGDTGAATIDTHGGLVDILASGAVKIGNSTNTAVVNAATLNIGSATSKVASIKEGSNGSIVATTVTARATSGITLTNSANAIGTANLYGGTTQITDSTNLVLGTVATGSLTATTSGTLGFGGGTVSGNLTATSNGDIGQTGALTVTGTSNFSAGTGVITLTQANNDFQDAVSLSGGAAQINDKNALTLDQVSTDDLLATSTGALNLGTGTVGGNLTATSNNGAITQASGGLAVTGTSTIHAGTGAITLGDAANDFTGLVTLTGGATQITSSGALSLGTLATGNLTVDSGDVLTFAGGTVTGSLDATSAGNLSQTGAFDVTGTSSFTSSGGGTVTLTDTGNAFGGAVSLTGGATQITSGGALSLGTLATGSLTATSTGALDLGQGTVGGALVATSNGGAITQDGALAIGGASTLDAGSAAITLADAANVFTGAVSATGGDVSLQSSGDLTVAALTSGTDASVSLIAGGSLFLPTAAIDTGLGNLTLAASGGSLGINGNLSGANVSLASRDGLNLAYDVTASGTLGLDSSSGVITQTAGTLTAGGISAITAAGDITLTGAANDFQDAVSLNGGSVQITDANALVLGTLATGDLTTNSVGSLTLGTGTVGGNLVATSGGAIDQASGGLAVTGTSNLDAGANAITLTDTGNDFAGAVNLTGGAVAITDSNALTLGTLATGALSATSTGALDLGQGTIGGNLSATSHGGAISQAGALTISGTSGIDAGGGTITLDNSANSFAGAVSLAGGDTRITNSGSLALGTLDTGNLTVVSAGALSFAGGSVGGNLDATSVGDISQGGALAVTGTSSFDAGTGVITLTQANNDFGGAVSLAGGTTQIVDRNALVLGTLAAGNLTATSHGNLDLGTGSLSGNLVATSNGGAISQAAGGLAISGNATVNAGSGAITLNDAANDFGGTVNLAGGATRITDANALSLGTLSTANLTAISHGALNLGSGTVAGNLAATSNDGAISQSGGLTVNGTSAINAGNAGISLAGPGNHFVGAVSLSNSGANNVAVDNGTHALLLGSSTVGTGTLSLAGNGIGQVGGITQAAGGGAVTLTAGSGALVLGNAGNDFTGTVDAQGASVSLSTLGDLHIVGMSVATNGSLSLVAGGALDLASFGAIDTGTGDLTLSAGDGLATSADLRGHDVSLAGGAGLTLNGNVTASGTLYLGSTNAAVSQTAGVLSAAGTTTVDAGTGTITLTSAGNDFQGAVSLTGGATRIVDANALTLGTLATGDLTATSTGNLGLGKGTVAGTLLATSNGGAIGQASGGLTVTGASTLNAGSGAITLADGNNNFAGTVNLTGGAVRITDRNALSLGTLATASLAATSTGALDLGAGNINGNLVASSNGGAITQDGALAVSGASSIDAGSGAITLANAANDFTGAVSLAGGATQLVDANALTLGTLDTGVLGVTSTGALNLGSGTVAGNLSAASNGGAISQSGALTVTGTSALDAATGSITLANAGNDFQGSVGLAGAGLSVRDANDLTIGTLAAAANTDVSLVAGGSLILPVSGIDTGTGNLVLAANGGTLATQGTLSGADVSLSGRDGLTLAHDVNATGTLTLVSTGGDITQTAGVLTAATLTGNALGNVTLGSANAIAALGSFSADGFLLRTAGGLTVNGAVAGGAGGVDIGSGGLLKVAAGISGHAIALQGAGISQTAGSINAGTGQVELTSSAGITQTGGSITAGTLTGSATADASLAGANHLVSLGSFDAANLSLTNAQDLVLAGPVTTSGATALTIGGDLAINGTLHAATVSLDVDGAVSEGASGNLVTGTLSGQAGGNVTLTRGNHVGTLGNFAAASFALTNAQALTVNGSLGVGTGSIALTTTAGALNMNSALSGGSIALDSAANLVLGKAINATTLSLKSAGSISQTATGLITAGTLSGQSAGATTLNQANAISTLGNFSADGFGLTSTRALTAAGTVDGGASTALAAGGNLRIDGTVKGDATYLSAGGTITEGASGNIVADALTGKASGTATLGGANHIGTLGNFQAAGFSLHDAQNLRVSGTVDGGASTTLDTAGNLAISGTVKGTSTRLNVTGALSESGSGRIVADALAGHVTGSAILTGNNAVASLGNLDAAGLSFTNAQALTIAGTVDGGASTTLTTKAGGLTVNGTLAGTSTSLDIAGGIEQSSQGRITAGTLTGQAGGDVALDGDNRIDTLGSFSAYDFALSNGKALGVNGPLTASGGGIALATTAGKLSVNTALNGDTIALDSAGDLALAQAVHGGAVTLVSGGKISQTADGIITADRLSGHSAGSTTLDQANAIGALDGFSASGLTVTTKRALTVTGTVDGGGSTTLTTGGSLAINGSLTGDTTTLAVSGNISEGSAGSITTHMLTGHATGAVALTGANRLDTLGQFTAAGFALSNGPSLTVTGPLDGGASVSLTTTRGDLLINGQVSGKATTLVSSGAITEGQGGSIVADTLSGRAGGYTQLGTANSPLANYIGTLGGFSSTASFSLTNAQTLTLASVDGSAYTVDAGTSSLYLGVTGGDLLQVGKTWLYDGEGTFASTGRIGTSDAPIYVTGTGPQAVALVGIPPAYFYAVNASGNLLPLTGGDSVNVPTSLFTSRAQNANNHTDVYIDPSVISADYRSYGIVPSGILLPADQQACDPEVEECDE
ncbi:filamentous hemagglutinin N-terminal domain-containing protein [Frateuria sp. GZRR33]|uniref:two-partner secretion domain-containing protein n=1 Tax=Frateuria sp. GZRR33 TaxID=3351535 RepID=UPI003EDB8FDF